MSPKQQTHTHRTPRLVCFPVVEIPGLGRRPTGWTHGPLSIPSACSPPSTQTDLFERRYHTSELGRWSPPASALGLGFGLGLGLDYTTGSPKCPVWQLQIAGLLSLHSYVSQFLIINVFICLLSIYVHLLAITCLSVCLSVYLSIIHPSLSHWFFFSGEPRLTCLLHRTVQPPSPRPFLELFQPTPLRPQCSLESPFSLSRGGPTATGRFLQSFPSRALG